MKAVSVIPITKAAPQEKLSYFTAKNVQSGDLVAIPLRGKIVSAIVSSTTDIKNIKISIKKSGFKLKSVKAIKAPRFLKPEFIQACEEIAKYFVSTLGSVIKEFVPQAVLENPGDGAGLRRIPNEIRIRGAADEISFIQESGTERLQYYKSVIREEFAKNRSVFFCLPTTSDVEEFSGELQKGIGKYSVALHGKMTAKKIKTGWSKALKEKHPILIIATKSFLSLPRNDISVVIVDKESSPFYKTIKKPYVDARKAAEFISKKIGARLIFGDSLIKTETFHGIAYEKFSQSSIPPSRILSEAEQILVYIGKNKESKWQQTTEFSAISPELKNILEKAYEKNEKVILFINRRGYSPTTICKDCSRTILCGKCDTPLVLHKNKTAGKNVEFICHKCLNTADVPEQCPYCKSWRLQTIGVGTQKIAEEIAEMFPKFKLFKMDSDSIKNAKQGKEIAELFMSTPGSVLIATEILFSFIRQLASTVSSGPAERVAIISVDSMFTLPDFRINEKIFHLLLKLRGLAKKTFLIQTRLSPPEENSSDRAGIEKYDIFNSAMRGNISGFYKTEIENRRRFQYPPFKTLVKITKESSNKTNLKKDTEAVAAKLAEWNPLSYPAFIPKTKNKYVWHILLKINPETWPREQTKLHQILSGLPPAWKIDVDPESLL